MSGSVTFRELVNLAIGSPELGAVNFNALHSLLHGLLDHLQLGDKRKTLSQEERDFIQPVPVSGDLATKDVRPTSLFHQLQDKMAKMEARLEHLDSLPTSDSLLQRSQQEKQPVQEMWQLIQLRKKVEMNEDGVHKVRSPEMWFRVSTKARNPIGARNLLAEPVGHEHLPGTAQHLQQP
uniref:Uncharacterized protein n=1 Tax=Xenopus tropicalis TaxID=8364 RepID=A0A1B8XSL1_XENTR